MYINGVKKPISSFLSIEKDTDRFISQMMGNERLKRLLFYQSKDALKRPNLSQEESLSLIDTSIKIVPTRKIDDEVRSYIYITFDKFLPTSNPEFRDCIIEFDILCHYDQWQLENFQLRPYKIAAEIDSMFNNKRFSGIGTLQFTGASSITIDETLGGVCLMYTAVHGEDDKKGIPNPEDQEIFLKDFADGLQNGIDNWD